jgi:hypothetical protein
VGGCEGGVWESVMKRCGRVCGSGAWGGCEGEVHGEGVGGCNFKGGVREENVSLLWTVYDQCSHNRECGKLNQHASHEVCLESSTPKCFELRSVTQPCWFS